MKHLATLILGFILLAACSETSKNEMASGVTEEKSHAKIVAANRVLKMEVTGMSCEMACGGSIRKALLETGAVSRVEFVEFDMDKATNIAKVYFDKEKIKVGKIKKIVSDLNDKQFKVGETSSEAFVDETISSSCKSSKDQCKAEKSKISVQSSSLELPNFFDLLKSVIN